MTEIQDCATFQIAGLDPLSLSALAHVQGTLPNAMGITDY
jgi:hypothetical protein